MNEFVGSAAFTLMDAAVLGVGSILFIISIILFVGSKRRKTNFTDLKKNDPEMVNQDFSDSKLMKLGAELESTKQELESVKKKLSDTESNLKNANPEILKQVLSDSKVVDLETELESTKQELVGVKKKLSDAESDLEDAEDDLEDFQKQLRKKKEENEELTEKFDSLTKEFEQINTDLKDKEEILKKKESDLTLKNGSIDFVNDILKAKQLENEDLNKRYRSIDGIVEYVRDEFSTCLDKNGFSRNENENLFRGGLDVWAQVSKKTWLGDKISVAFVGEFSAGKTSIVNSIIKANDKNSQLLPTSAKATTAIPTYISASSSGEENYLFFSTDNKIKKIDRKVFEVTKEMLDPVKGVETVFKYFIVSYNNPNLNNLSILDTPGFSSEDKKDAERTIEVINECDALFWCFDVNNGEVNESSLKTIKANLKKPLYIVINKVDTVAPTEVDKVEERIKETFKNKKIKVEKIIRYCNDPSVVPTETIINTLKSVKRTNNTNDYIANLLKFAEECVDQQKKASKAARDEWIECSNKVDEANDKLCSQIEIVVDDCNDARNMPSWTTHIFHSDKYEMSEETGNRFKDLMDKIADDEMSNMKNLVQELADSVKDYQNANQKDDEERRKKDEIENCVAGLKKLIKAFNNSGRLSPRNLDSDSSDNDVNVLTTSVGNNSGNEEEENMSSMWQDCL